ncbi:MAG: hypothetical protein ACYTGC_17410 [Planctomycetota bacterium]|jgi:quinol monooxygenase YgiN
MKKSTFVFMFAAAGAIGLAGLAVAQRAQEAPRDAAPDLGARLIEGLRATPGCLGVDAGNFMSGKNAIMAWFEDKDAVVRWYHSAAHQQAMRAAFGEEEVDAHEHAPLRHVESGGPIMVIASITFTDEPRLEGVAMPISQIAIELYTPLPGGAHMNGRLAPATFRVKHMKEYTPPPAG